MRKRKIYLPWAHLPTEAIVYTGQNPLKHPSMKPQRALGRPNYRNTEIADFISIGCDGELVSKFVDNVLVDVEGVDLYVFEVRPLRRKLNLRSQQMVKTGSTSVPLKRAVRRRHR